MGGIGKTALARNAYDDLLIVEHFDIRAWVKVSQYRNSLEIVSDLLIYMGMADTKIDSMNLAHVYQNLKERRYLIVLDDMWDKEAWDYLKMMFPDDNNGSRIMLTTRLANLAAIDANSSGSVHKMDVMAEEQSWNLLRQKVFKRDPCPRNLEYIGKRIARWCRGHPLTIAVISGILSADLTKDAWEDIAENMKSTADLEGYEQFVKTVCLSYTCLPHHLRPCFLYMAGFPEDCEMRVSRLIKLWVAEGFLEPNGSKSFEEIAEEYLEDLVKRSLVLATKRKSNGRIKCVSVHDLVREMCIRKAQKENFFLQVHRFLRRGMKIPRRVSVFRSNLNLLEKFYGSTIHCVVLEGRLGGMPCCLGSFKLVRILDLSYSYDSFQFSNSYPFVPAEIFELLFHLRYLASDYPFSIPAAISNLWNLQTLIIRAYDNRFVELPVEIWRMPQLRHLVVLSCVLPSPEGATFALKNLQTLSKAVNLICSEEILKMIPNLKKLQLFYKGRGDYEGFQLHNLKYLKNLEDLKIEMHNFPEKQQRVGLAFPITLKNLALGGLRLPWKDMKIVGSLPNLEVLKLRDDACIGGAWETTEGQFSRLKFLLIVRSDLQNWLTESKHFPRLKCLVLHCWECLYAVPNGIVEIPTLELIEVDELNNSLVDSAKMIQYEQQRLGNNVLQVCFVRKSF